MRPVRKEGIRKRKSTREGKTKGEACVKGTGGRLGAVALRAGVPEYAEVYRYECLA